jgi:hypothetical protein
VKRRIVIRLFPMLVTMGLATAPTVAQAAAPEFGRCLALPGAQGAYSNNSCTSASLGKTGKFEWFPGVAKASFTTSSKEGTKVLF